MRPRSGLYGLDNRRASIITCSERVFVALRLQNAMGIAILSPVASPALQYFSTLLHKGTIFEKKSNIKFHDNLSSGYRVLPYGQKDGHDVTYIHPSKFCGRTKKMAYSKRGNSILSLK